MKKLLLALCLVVALIASTAGRGLSRSSGVAGGSTLLETHTASASATLDFTTWYSSRYDEYVIEFVSLLPASDNVALYMLLSTDGGSSYDTGANYRYAEFVNAFRVKFASGNIASGTVRIYGMKSS